MGTRNICTPQRPRHLLIPTHTYVLSFPSKTIYQVTSDWTRRPTCPTGDTMHSSQAFNHLTLIYSLPSSPFRWMHPSFLYTTFASLLIL